MRALITGGSGYFGSLLLDKLLDSGYNCSVFDIMDFNDKPEDVDFYQGDIRNPDAIARACENVDVVFHNVAQVPLAKDKSLFEEVNIAGTENLLEACVKHKVGKVVYTSSSAVYGVPESNPVSEVTIPTPMEAYGKAKYKAEQLCKEYSEADLLNISIVRPRTIVGHGRLGIFQILFEWIFQGVNVPVLDDGKNTYQFVHADDLADACLLIAKRPNNNDYNIGASDYGTMRELLENLCVYAESKSRVKSIPLNIATMGMNVTSSLGLSPLGAYHSLMYGKSMFFDITKAQTELDWQPKYSSKQMFEQSYDWYLDNRDSVLYDSKKQSAHRSKLKEGALGLLKWII